MARFNNEKNGLEELKKEVVRKFPSLGPILNSLQMKYSRRVNTAGAASKAVYFNPNYLEGISHGERIGIMAHEVMHVAFRHIPRSKNKNPELWNIATDAVINNMIKEENIPLPKGGVDMPEVKGQSAEEVYNYLAKKYKEACEKRKKQSGQPRQGDQNDQQNGQGQASEEQQPQDRQGQSGNQQGQQSQQREKSQQNQDGSRQGEQEGQSGQQRGQGEQGQSSNGGQQGEQRQRRDKSQRESGSGSGKFEGEQEDSDQSSENEDSLDDGNDLPTKKDKLDRDALRDVLGNNSLPQNHQDWNKSRKKIEKKEKKNGKNGQDENNTKDERSELNKFKQDDKPQSQQDGDNFQNSRRDQRQQNGDNSQNSRDDQPDDSEEEDDEFDDESENGENDEDFEDEFEEAEPSGDEGEDQDKLDENADYDEMEKNFTQKNQKIRREKAEEIRSRLKSEVQQSGVSDYAYQGNFGAVGEAKAALSWKQILKREFEKEESRWGYRRASRENYYSARIQDMEDYEQPVTEVCLDTSGSIDDDLLKGFLRQLKTIVKESKLRVGCFSDRFYGFKEIKTKKDIDNYHFVGRGGTNLDSAVMAFSNDKRVNKIIFTDGEDDSYPRTNRNVDCIWLVFDNPSFKAASGKVVYVERKIMYDQEDSQSSKTDDDDDENYL